MVETRNPDISEADLRAEHGGWLDGNPYYLMIVLADGRFAEIDLGEKGWVAKYEAAGFLSAGGQWYLVRKEDKVIVLTQLVYEGEQPYYVAKHVGFASVGGNGPDGETTVYGIGKKRLDGHTDRVWIMRNGCITLGDDAEPIALDLLKRGHL